MCLRSKEGHRQLSKSITGYIVDSGLARTTIEGMQKGYIVDLGLMAYREAWDFQRKLFEMRVEDAIPDTLIFVEHEHVITKGRSTNEENLIATPGELEDNGVSIYEVERGGDVTYHGPGQLVGYPIFKLEKGLIGVRPFVAKIEDSLVQAMEEFGIQAAASMKMPKGQPIGVWVDESKLAAIGVAIKRWTSFHGFALNVSTNLDMFGLIVPCGLKDKGVTSMEKLLEKKVDMEEVKKAVRGSFEDVFNISLEERDMEDF